MHEFVLPAAPRQVELYILPNFDLSSKESSDHVISFKT